MITKGIFTIAELENVQINIGELVELEEDWEPIGPTLKPGIISLRSWDYKLLGRYNPVYTPTSDLTGNKEGACGINLEAQQGRMALLTAVMGAACHSAHGRHLLNYFIQEYGKDHPIDVGPSNLKMPLTQTIVGIQPKTIGNLTQVY